MLLVLLLTQRALRWAEAQVFGRRGDVLIIPRTVADNALADALLTGGLSWQRAKHDEPVPLEMVAADAIAWDLGP